MAHQTAPDPKKLAEYIALYAKSPLFSPQYGLDQPQMNMMQIAAAAQTACQIDALDERIRGKGTKTLERYVGYVHHRMGEMGLMERFCYELGTSRYKLSIAELELTRRHESPEK